MGLTDHSKTAFRAVLGPIGQPSSERCLSWVAVNMLHYGGYPADLFIFHLGEGGKAEAVEVPFLQKTLRKNILV